WALWPKDSEGGLLVPSFVFFLRHSIKLNRLAFPQSATRPAGTPPGRLVRAGLANGRMVRRPSDWEIASQSAILFRSSFNLLPLSAIFRAFMQLPTKLNAD